MTQLAEALARPRWYAVIAGEEMGPFSDTELKVLATRGAIGPATKLRHFDMAEQHEARRIAGLFAGTPLQAPIASARRSQAPAPIARAPALETGVRFQRRLAKPTNDFALRGAGVLRIEPDAIEVQGRCGDAGRGEATTLRFAKTDLIDTRRNGNHIGFKVRARDAGEPERWMSFYTRSKDVAHDIEAALPLRPSRAAPPPSSSAAPEHAAQRVPRQPWVVPALMVAMIAMFVVTLRHGGGWFEMDPLVHVRMGSNLGELTSRGDWWRLFSGVLLHAGVLHLALNLWALFELGRAAERRLGAVATMLVLLVGATAGHVASLAWSADAHAVGASGAVLGLAGALAAASPDGLRTLWTTHRIVLVAFGVGSLLLAFTLPGVDPVALLAGGVAGVLIGAILKRIAVGGFARRRAERVVVALLVPVVLATIALPVLHRTRLIHHERTFERGVATLAREQSTLDAGMQSIIETLRSGRYSVAEVVQGLESQHRAWGALNAQFTRLPLEPRAHYAELHGQLQHYTSLRSRAAQALAASLRTRDEIRAREGAALHASAKQIESGLAPHLRAR